MINIELYIKQGLQVIKDLIKKGDLSNALHACQELLKVNPYHIKVQKYLEEIEKLIVKTNIKKVDTDIDATMHLWKEEKYNDLLNIYTKLYQYAPNYGRLVSLIEKAYKKLESGQKEQRSAFIKNAIKIIDELISKENFGDAIQACNELIAYDPLNEKAKQYLLEAKNKLIEKKLAENQHLLDSADFDRLNELYDSLLAINPENQKIKSRQQQLKASIAEKNLLAEKIHLNESIVRMKELFNKAEYEKALQACEEIDRLDPGNFSAKVFKKKAKQSIDEESDMQILKKIKENLVTLKQEYQKSPQTFVKI